MSTQLIQVEIPSIYFRNGKRVMLPKSMAKFTPDTAGAIKDISDWVRREVPGDSEHLFFSDGYRTYEMQLQAHLDWKCHRKSAYSPPPGSSFHEAGRAVDFDVPSICLHIGYNKFYEQAKSMGWSFVIPRPQHNLPEAWHMEWRGIYNDMVKRRSYKEAVIAAILDIDGKVDDDIADDDIQEIQMILKYLGYDPGPTDGILGKRTMQAIMLARLDHSNIQPRRDFMVKLNSLLLSNKLEGVI